MQVDLAFRDSCEASARTKFHEQVKRDMENYVTTLRDASSTKLRANFREKMNLICQN
jgi:hypothetical protein